MHDPMTVAWSIKAPLWRTSELRKPEGTLIRKDRYFYELATIWHVDPERDGSDDSCGWFMRARHGNPKTLEKITQELKASWDGAGGWFNEDGSPRLSTIAITLCMFHRAHMAMYGYKWGRSDRFMRRHLYELIRFAENPVDSLNDSIEGRWGFGRSREERIEGMAQVVYGWILRTERPWFCHPRWHVHHWRIQIRPLQQLNRWLFSRCAVCKRGFKWNESVMGSWGGDKIWHMGCDQHPPTGK
jgi:hypothetical protein